MSPCLTDNRNLLPPEAAQSRPKPPRPGVGVRDRSKNLAGRFLPEVDEAPLIENPEDMLTPFPMPTPAAKRVGRPRVHASAAEKQKAYRERRDQIDDAAEKEQLIEAIVRKTRHGQSKLVLSGAGVAWEARQKSNAAQLRTLREGLEQLDLEALRNYAITLKETADHKGRLNNEHTGSVGSMSLPEAAQVSAERSSTGRVSPSGAGPCDYGVDADGGFDDMDSEDTAPNKIVFDDLTLHQYKEKAIDDLLDDGICKVCGQTGSQHLYDAFSQALNALGFLGLLDGVGAPKEASASERRKLVENDHYEAIRKQICLLRQQDVGETKKGRRLARLGKAEAKKCRLEEHRRKAQMAKKEGWKL